MSPVYEVSGQWFCDIRGQQAGPFETKQDAWEYYSKAVSCPTCGED